MAQEQHEWATGTHCWTPTSSYSSPPEEHWTASDYAQHSAYGASHGNPDANEDHPYNTDDAYNNYNLRIEA